MLRPEQNRSLPKGRSLLTADEVAQRAHNNRLSRSLRPLPYIPPSILLAGDPYAEPELLANLEVLEHLESESRVDRAAESYSTIEFQQEDPLPPLASPDGLADGTRGEVPSYLL